MDRWLPAGTAFARENLLALIDEIIGGARRQRHNRQPRIGRPLCGEGAAIADKEVRNVVRLPEAINHRRARVIAHARRPNQMRVARFLHHLKGARRPHHLFDLLFAKFDHLFIVVVQIKGHMRHRQTVLVFGLFIQCHAVIRPGQNLAEQAQRAPVVIIHHLAAQRPAPGALGGDKLLSKGNRLRPDGLNGEAARKIAPGVGLVKLLGQRVRGRGFIHADQVFKLAQNYIARLRHQVFAYRAAGVCQASFKARASRVEQQARRLNGVAANNDYLCLLLALAHIRVKIGHAGCQSLAVEIDARHHAVIAHLGAIIDPIGDMRVERAGLGANFAALDTEAAIDAVGPVSMRAGVDRHRPTGSDANAQLCTALDQHITHPAQRVRPVGIAMWVAPGKIGRAGDRQLALQQFIVGLHILIGDRPVGPHAILAVDAEI